MSLDSLRLSGINDIENILMLLFYRRHKMVVRTPRKYYRCVGFLSYRRITSAGYLLSQLFVAICHALKVSRNNLDVYKDVQNDLRVFGSLATSQEDRNNLPGWVIPRLSIFTISIL